MNRLVGLGMLFVACLSGFEGSSLRADEPILSEPGFSEFYRPGQKVFLIGNSLTADTLPALLGDGVEWHIDCGKNLNYILENPEKPCVESSSLWNRALKAETYDVLVVQPYSGSNLAQDVAAISRWLELQPQAALVLHTGWAGQARFEADFHTKPAPNAGPEKVAMLHSPAYFERLEQELHAKFPKLSIRSTHAIDVLEQIYHDIEQGRAPLTAFAELYRDDVHMDLQRGRYLAHNLMRIALDRPLSGQGFNVDASCKAYLDKKLAEVVAADQARAKSLPETERE